MDSKDLKIVAILAVLAVVVIAAVTVIGGGNNDKGGDDPAPVEPEPEDPLLSADMIMVCSYSISKTMKTTYSSVTAPNGKEFVIAHYSASNVSESPISLNSLYYNLVIDGVEYSRSAETYSHPDRTDAESIGPDAYVSNVLVYEVPYGSDISTCKMVWAGFDDINLYVVKMENTLRYNIGEPTYSETIGDKTAPSGSYYLSVPYVIQSDGLAYAYYKDAHISLGLTIRDVIKDLSDIDDMGLLTSGETIRGTWVFVVNGQHFDKIYLNNADLDETLIV